MSVGIAGVGASLSPINTGQTLYSAVVETDAQLADALANDRGDTFIRAGAYTVDLDTVVFDTTPRRFVGAGMNAVTIEWTATGPATPDFSAGRTDTDGVIFENVTFTSLTPFVGPGLIQGLYAASQVTCLGTATVSSNGFVDCWNCVNCTATGFNGVFFGAGFQFCLYLANCAVIGFDAEAYFLCLDLTNCTAVPLAFVGFIPDDAAFNLCADLSACIADYTGVTVVGAPHHGFAFCSRLAACEFDGPTGAPIVGLNGYSFTEDLGACFAQFGEINYNACAVAGGCDSTGASVFGFNTCKALGGCRSTGDAVGFFGCNAVSGCHALGTSVGDTFSDCFAVSGCHAQSSASHGFENCTGVTGCWAEGTAGDGFRQCTEVAGCRAESTAGDGFHACVAMASTNVTGATGWDYAAVCNRISSARGDAAGLGLSDGSNTAVDPVTAAGI